MPQSKCRRILVNSWEFCICLKGVGSHQAVLGEEEITIWMSESEIWVGSTFIKYLWIVGSFQILIYSFPPKPTKANGVGTTFDTLQMSIVPGFL